jgi:hypothetical protein
MTPEEWDAMQKKRQMSLQQWKKRFKQKDALTKSAKGHEKKQ